MSVCLSACQVSRLYVTVGVSPIKHSLARIKSHRSLFVPSLLLLPTSNRSPSSTQLNLSSCRLPTLANGVSHSPSDLLIDHLSGLTKPSHFFFPGILATGGIAATFTKDLLTDPATRDVSDVHHHVAAVASSSSADRAAKFIADVGLDPSKCNAYGSYEELVKDPEVQIIYVATPHSHHYENTLLCLENGKHVCCEVSATCQSHLGTPSHTYPLAFQKPFTINAKQSAHLAKVAKEKNLFLMEAVWIRFFPIVLEIQKLLHQDRVLGKIHRVFSDFGMPFKPDPKHRLFNPELGGGALLDLGIYALTWQMLTLFQDPDNQRTPPKVTGSIVKTPLTGVDEYTTMVLNFDKLGAQGVATTNMTVRSPHQYVVLVQGEKGDLTVPWAPYRPERYTLHLKDSEGNYTEPKTKEFPIPGHG